VIGDTIRVKVTVKNTGDVSYTFWVGCSFRDRAGRAYDVRPSSIYLAKHFWGGDSGTVTFSWAFPYNIAKRKSEHDRCCPGELFRYGKHGQRLLPLSMRDVKDKLLRIAGVKAKAKEEESLLTPKTCPRCKYANPATSRFCSQCSMILDLDTAMKLEDARAKADNVMSNLFEDPETQRFLATKIRKLGITAEKRTCLLRRG